MFETIYFIKTDPYISRKKQTRDFKIFVDNHYKNIIFDVIDIALFDIIC